MPALRLKKRAKYLQSSERIRGNEQREMNTVEHEESKGGLGTTRDIPRTPSRRRKTVPLLKLRSGTLSPDAFFRTIFG